MEDTENFNNPEHKEELDQAIKSHENSVWGFFVRRSRIIYILLTLIILLGFYAIAVMPKEAEPEVRVPFAAVTVIYPGASPTDVEDLVLNELEDTIKDIDNIKRLNSSASLGVASIFIEFSAEADLDESLEDLKDAVDEAKPNLPEVAEEPIVQDINFNDVPIVTYSLSGPYNDVVLKDFAETLQDAFEDVQDVSKAPILGGLEREIQILVDQSKLAQFGMSLGEVVSAIGRSNVSLPSGEIEVGDFNYSVRVKGKFAEAKDIGSVVITFKDDAPIFVSDVAEVRDTFKDRSSISRIGFDEEGSNNTVSLQIFKRTGGNILNIVKNAEKAVAELKAAGSLPADLDIIKTNDNSTFIKDDIARLGTSGIQTTILIVIILFLVLGIRGSIITGLSVPLAFLIAFIVLFIQGQTINSMVLFALVLSLGLMVDNSIIIMEGINEYLYKHNRTPYEAALLSIWNYKWPIITGTLTTVSAFLPMLLVSGIIGEYMGILPKTITATLLASLFVSLVVIPALSAKFYGRSRKNKEPSQKHQKISAKLDKFKKSYIEFLRAILTSKKKRRRSIWLAVLLVILTILMPVVGIMRIEMFPKVDIEYFAVSIELPTGSTLEKTTEVVEEVEKVVGQLPELKNYVSTVGQGFSAFAGEAAASGEHVASIIVNLVDEKERKDKPSYEIADDFRPKLTSIEGAKIEVQELTAGPPSAPPFEVRLFGDDLPTLYSLAREMRGIAEDIDGLINVNDSVEESSGEFVFTVNREQAAFYGLEVGTVAQSIRQAVYGAEATEITSEGDDVSVLVKYDQDNLQDANALENLLLFPPGREPVIISQVADLTLEPSVLSINHFSAERIVRITAQSSGNADIRSIYDEFNNIVNSEIALPDGYRIEVGGEFEDLQRSFSEIFLSMFLAVFLIIFILVLQFDSFKQPFVIIFSLPLAIVGAFVGLTLLGLAFSLPAFIGIVSLAGIVVNDSIVLIDRINKNIKRKMPFIEGVLEAGVARMQPIFLTSITTIAGVFPLALSEDLWAGLGFSIIFGLMFATVLTLVYIPIIYTSLCMKDHEKAS